jgi:GTP cyclohydrolase I|tara:strand:+ start:1271 stop:1933 length:663 start_codon:yes stop_codon:yes gene_type:complete
MSKIIKDKIKKLGGSFLANDNISQYLEPKDLLEIQKNTEQAMVNLLDALVIDVENDHNTIDTAKRVAKMYVQEVFKGRYLPQPKITDFPNVKDLDQIYTIGPITVRSACSHHLVPIIGHAWIGVIPSDRVIGISKFNRLTDWVMSRPQIQEESTVQLADEIETLIKPKALAVVVKAKHLCMSWRGVKDNSSMSTSVMRGLFKDDNGARNEFLNIIKGQEY